MNSQNSLEDILKMSDPVLTTPTLIEDIETPMDESKHQKSLISIYDNNSQQQSIINSHSLVCIIGRNQRSKAFTKRLLLSGFPKPILYDTNSIENYVSYELSPSIVLITDNLTRNCEDLFSQNHQQLIIDTRENVNQSIPNSYRAFGNLSNWEIENGTERIGVAIEQFSPLNLIKFIYDLNCFSRGIYFLDQYSYNNQQMKSFHNCLFPFISMISILSLCLILSVIEHMNESYNSISIYRQASSITATTSITLLALLFLIRPILEIMEFVYSMMVSKKQNFNENLFLPNMRFIQRWLESRRYLAFYSLAFAFLHILFVIFSKIDFNSKLFTYAFFFGIFSIILLSIISHVHFPWISKRLLWKEYHILTGYLGPFCLLIALIHVFLHWKVNSDLFNLKFFSMILPLVVFLIRFIIYGIIHPIFKLKTKDTSSLLS